MTDKLIMTTEQRDQFPELIDSLLYGTHKDAAAAKQTMLNMLQSLPVVADKPCGYGQFDPDGKLCDAHDFQDSHVYTAPLYTSPQAPLKD